MFNVIKWLRVASVKSSHFFLSHTQSELKTERWTVKSTQKKILNTLINYLTRDLMACASLRYTSNSLDEEHAGSSASKKKTVQLPRELAQKYKENLQKSLFNEFIKKSIKFYDYLFSPFRRCCCCSPTKAKHFQFTQCLISDEVS